MQALIFAAGLGTRLKPFTETHPKALFPVAGKPLLAHVLLKLKAVGCTDVVINIHHFGEQIIDYIQSQQGFGLHIQFSDERGKLLETGGGIKKAQSLLKNEAFILHNVDILSNADIASLYDFHLRQDADATLLVSDRDSTRKLYFTGRGQLAAWQNLSSGEVKPTGADVSELCGFAFSGIHVFSPRLLPLMQSWPDCFSVVDFYLGTCRQAYIRGKVQADLQLMDVGKADSAEQAAQFLQQIQ